jgi:phosphatidylserine synthase
MSLNRIDAIKRILDDQNALGARADSKAVALLTTLGLFTAFFIYVVNGAPVNYFSSAMIFIYLICTVLALYNVIMTIYPRIRTGDKETTSGKPDPNKAAFYADICQFENAGDYKGCLQEMLKDEQILEDVYTRQIYEVSLITSTKYKYARRAVLFVVLAVSSEFCLIAYIFASNLLL